MSRPKQPKPIEVGAWHHAPKLVRSNHNVKGQPVEVVKAGTPYWDEERDRWVQHCTVRDVRGRKCHCQASVLGRRASDSAMVRARRRRLTIRVERACQSLTRALGEDEYVTDPAEVETARKAGRLLLALCEALADSPSSSKETTPAPAPLRCHDCHETPVPHTGHICDDCLNRRRGLA